MAGNTTDGRSVASKAVAVLLVFTDGEAHTLTQIACATDLPLSTAHRLVHELAGSGLLQRAEDGTYQVGAVLHRLNVGPVRDPMNQLFALTRGTAGDLPERAAPVMNDVSVATGERVRLGVLVDDRVSYVEQRPGHQTISRFRESDSLAVHTSAMGRVILAFAPPSIVQLIIFRAVAADSPQAAINRVALHKALTAIRVSRVAVCPGGPPGGAPSTVAVPIFDETGAVTAALDITVRDLRMDLRRLYTPLVMAARCLSRQLTSPLRTPAPGHDDCPAAAEPVALHLITATEETN